MNTENLPPLVRDILEDNCLLTKDTMYDQFTMSTFKDPDDIVAELSSHKAAVLHAATIIAKEAGELLDAVARLVFYDKTLDLDNVEEELGDIEYGMSTLRQSLGINRNDTIDKNVLKLSKRYAAGRFSNEQANARADKPTGE